MMASQEDDPAEIQQHQEQQQGAEGGGSPPPTGTDAFNPFTDADLQRILDEEKSNSEADGWKFASRSQYSEIWRKQVPNQSIHLIKGYLHFPGIPPSDVVEMINNLEVRQTWDKQFPVIDVLEQHKDYRVVYWLAKMPPVVADRDLVQYISQRTDPATNTTYLLYRNATHPDRPERSGLVRAETILSGNIIRPDADDRNSTRMSILLQTDAKGWIPHFAINVLAARAPRNWQQSLYNFYTNVYSKQKQQQKAEEKTAASAAADATAVGGEEEGVQTQPSEEEATAALGQEKPTTEPVTTTPGESGEDTGESGGAAGGEQETESKEDDPPVDEAENPAD